MTAHALADLDRDLVRFFASGATSVRDDAAFNALALGVFACSYEALASYRAYCQRRGALPARLRHWTEIPAVPVQAFRDVRLQCDVTVEPARVFRTSGTTTTGQRPGEHYMTPNALALYEASLLATFRAFVLPEVAAGARSALVPLALLSPPAETPHSSLGFMIERAGAAWFERAPRWFMAGGALDVAEFIAAAEAAARDKCGVLVIATDLALDRLLGDLEAKDARIALPSGSRVLHTGGSKGMRVELDVAQLYARVEARLGVRASRCVNEYGMTELASQFYDDALVRDDVATSGATPRAAPGAEAVPRLKHGPPWTRALVVDVQTLEPLPAGRPGLLRIWDLANRGSVPCVQTEDLAIADASDDDLDANPAGGPLARAALVALGSAPFRLLGRARGSEPRGCSLEAEVPVS